jgi:hypothetical protein
MSQVNFENFWPFEEPGRQANMARWRRMGRLWIHNGVVQGVGEQFLPRAWEPHNQRFLVGTGAVTIEGFYGATENWTWVSTPGNDGSINARLDPGTQRLELRYDQNWHSWHDDPWASHGIVETPIIEVWPDGRWADRRLMVSPDIVQGLERIPEWVPKGYLASWYGPGAASEIAPGAYVHYVWLSSAPGWVAGRHVRVSAWASASRASGENAWVHFRALAPDQATVIKESRLIFPWAAAPVHGYAEFVLPSSQECLLAIQVVLGWGTLRFEASSCYIEVADLGI